MPAFMRRTLAALAVLPAVIAAVLPPETQSADGSLTHSEPWLIELDHQNARATLGIPCLGQCDGESSDDDHLVFDVQAFPSIDNSACSSTNLTINGGEINALTTWNDGAVIAEGWGSLQPYEEKSAITSRSTVPSISSSWKVLCLEDEPSDDSDASDASDDSVNSDNSNSPPTESTQLLSLRIDKIGDKVVDEEVGFTISFRQAGTPILLRLGALNPIIEVPEWRNPPSELLMKNVCSNSNVPADSFDEELEKLRQLELQAMYLHAKIHAQKEVLRAFIDRDEKSLKEELSECDSFMCFAKTILKKAHGAARVLFHKMSHHPRRDHSPSASWPKPEHEPLQAFVSAAPADGAADGSSSISNASVRCKAAGPAKDHRPMAHRLPAHLKLEHDINPLIISFKIVSLVTILIGIFLILHRSCSPRRRAERRARREERRKRRAYRHAARIQAFRNWWQERRTWLDQFRAHRRHAPMDCEEKRAVVLQQEEVLESAMQEEIRQLRNAHSTVNSIVRSTASPMTGTVRTPPSTRHSDAGSLPEYRSDSETTDPPEYESEDESGTFVSNGFSQYTPSPSSPTVSEGPSSRAGSSIIEVSPRPSAETMRTWVTS